MSYITFLGTGTSQGVPVIGCNCKVCRSEDKRDRRLRSSALIEHRGKKILIDAGPDFRMQLLQNRIDNIDAILLTHQHKDHTGGLDDIRPINYFQKKAIPIYCEKRVIRSLSREYYYAFEGRRRMGIPHFHIHEIINAPFTVEGIEVTPIRVMHSRLPILGFRIGNLTYITDASHIEESELEKVMGSEILVLNAIRKEPHFAHFCLHQALKIVDRVKPKMCYLTHLSHQMGPHKEILKMLPENVTPAYDQLKVGWK